MLFKVHPLQISDLMPRLLLLPIDPRRLAGFARRDACQVPEHQLYAVEKWCVDRTRLVSLLVVYTGHADHSVLLDVFHTDDLALFDRTVAALRADGARTKQTEHGVLMVTSLAHFRSDYAIVPIPHGRFLPAVRDQLYANIDLLRIGASGRTALTLEDPTEATKERFASTYHIPSTDVDLVHAVLRLVSLIQSALAIFGLYPHPIDGLLCDATLNAIRQWTASVGTPCLSLSPPPDKPIPDPPFVAALFSLVLSSRNKLADLGYPLPSDPFIRPSSFFPLLSPEIVQAISSSKQDKHALINPTTDLASFVSHIISPPSLASNSGATKRDSSLSLRAAVATDSSSAFDHLNSLASLRALWAPNLSSSLVFPRSRPSRSSRIQGSRGGAASDGDGDHHSSKPRRYFDGARSTEEDSDIARHAFRWKGKLGSWAGGLAKRKHQSVDLSATSSRHSSLRAAHPNLGAVLPPIPPPKDKSKRTKSPIAKLPQSQSQPQSRTSTLGHESTQCLSLITSNLNLAVPTRSQSYTSSPKRDTPRRPGPPSRRSTVATVPEQGGVSHSARAQSPTLPPMGFFGEPEDDDLLSSGQVSPLSDTHTRPNPFHIYYQSPAQATATSSYLQPPLPTRPPLSSRQSSNTNANPSPLPTNSPTTIDEKVLSKLLLDSKQKQKRKYHHHSNFGPQARIASWAGPVGGGAWGGAEASAEAEGEEGEENELEEQESDASLRYHAASGSAAPPLLPSKGIGATGRIPTATASGRGAKPTPPDPGLPSASTPASAWLRKKEKARFHSLLSVVDGDGQLHEEVTLGSGGVSGSAGSEDGEVEWEREWHRGKGERGVEYEEEEEGYEEEEEFDEEEEERMEMLRRRTRVFEPKRRRSFHDLDTFREVDVSSPERMKIDVELCGQCLIMWRREKHLQNVLGCVRHISTSLSTSNTSLRTHLSKHHPPSHLSSLTSQSSSLLLLPIPVTDEMAQKSERYTQGTNVLLYETEQFGVKALWAAASAMRRKVWDLREGVFGADAGSGSGGVTTNASGSWGGDEQQRQQRRPLLPPGAHGAHGSFNRLQWRLDGRSVLVDQLGRTESEAEEEALLDAELEISGSATPGGGGLASGPATAASTSALPSRHLGGQINGEAEAEGAAAGLKVEPSAEEDSEDVVDHPGIKPVWLLRFFTSWRARWSAVAAASSPSPSSSPVATGAATRVPSAASAAGASSTPLLNSSSGANANVGGGDTLMGATSNPGGATKEEVQRPTVEKDP